MFPSVHRSPSPLQVTRRKLRQLQLDLHQAGGDGASLILAAIGELPGMTEIGACFEIRRSCCLEPDSSFAAPLPDYGKASSTQLYSGACARSDLEFS
jgi:hypothetical protein